MTRFVCYACAFLALAGCDDSPTSTPAPAEAETRLVGQWAPVINSYGHFWDVRTTSEGVLKIRSGFRDDSLPFTYSASGGKIQLVMEGKEESGTYRFFGNDSMELKTPSVGYLMIRVAQIPAS